MKVLTAQEFRENLKIKPMIDNRWHVSFYNGSQHYSQGYAKDTITRGEAIGKFVGSYYAKYVDDIFNGDKT